MKATANFKRVQHVIGAGLAGAEPDSHRIVSKGTRRDAERNLRIEMASGNKEEHEPSGGPPGTRQRANIAPPSATPLVSIPWCCYLFESVSTPSQPDNKRKPFSQTDNLTSEPTKNFHLQQILLENPTKRFPSKMERDMEIKTTVFLPKMSLKQPSLGEREKIGLRTGLGFSFIARLMYNPGIFFGSSHRQQFPEG